MTYDLVVVGGGPAGVAGALTAALGGLRVALVDSGLRLGGQYFRHPAVPGRAPGLERFLRQARALDARGEVLLRHQVWAVSREPDGDLLVHCVTRDAMAPDARVTVLGERVTASGEQVTAQGEQVTAQGDQVTAQGERRAAQGERAVVLRARRLLIATGAHDRPLPFPGWDLPGVLTAGGAQALLKGGGVVAGRRIVVSGTGPFLLPVAAGLAGAGARVLGVYEANGGLGLARHPVLALGKAGEAAGYAAALARHRVPYRARHAVVAAHGEREVEAVTVGRLDKDWNVTATRVVECDSVAVGYGFVPQIELGTQLGCLTRHDVDGSPVLAVDATLRTSVPGVWAAGEPVGVGGWRLAELEGRLAGRAIVADARTAPTADARGATGTGQGSATGAEAEPEADGRAGGVPVEGSAAAVVPPLFARRRERWRAFGEALQRAYPVKPGWQSWLRDDTLVCRCEEVPLARVREAQALGATDARAIKLLARPGMGWCQGRVCGYAVSCLAGERPQPPRRPIAQPVTLGTLASLTNPEGGPDGNPDDDPAH
ncbi:FAD-dependent oxidoreductase [Nonomuraea gerenzanensis]|uniref:Putative oxidoreductase in 4-hydroxyproline catabolic gene cluster n=1 Tax=Nonomuraea gerenzanensis TaxID=93944 RepID=A0A1M4EGU7_9ACTN|nr:FAD-dependent oxidoreductase [Nonomuraea gerenzanensis]UBU09751.1 FAD-dependent oxidoreductase [Nonomuraea gerenzanensis]SBO98191.1 Putative oxidoreductase in 4-hydroxyproline catabolic gene cluster [Nonomuraea gerenzanensis]